MYTYNMYVNKSLIYDVLHKSKYMYYVYNINLKYNIICFTWNKNKKGTLELYCFKQDFLLLSTLYYCFNIRLYIRISVKLFVVLLFFIFFFIFLFLIFLTYMRTNMVFYDFMIIVTFVSHAAVYLHINFFFFLFSFHCCCCCNFYIATYSSCWHIFMIVTLLSGIKCTELRTEEMNDYYLKTSHCFYKSKMSVE